MNTVFGKRRVSAPNGYLARSGVACKKYARLAAIGAAVIGFAVTGVTTGCASNRPSSTSSPSGPSASPSGANSGALALASDPKDDGAAVAHQSTSYPGPCARLSSDAETTASLLSHRGSTELVQAFDTQMTDEGQCSSSFETAGVVAREHQDDAASRKDEAAAMRHRKEEGKAALNEALCWADSSLTEASAFKENLLHAAQLHESTVVYYDSGADDATRKEAKEIMSSAAEQLAKIKQ